MCRLPVNAVKAISWLHNHNESGKKEKRGNQERKKWKRKGAPAKAINNYAKGKQPWKDVQKKKEKAIVKGTICGICRH